MPARVSKSRASGRSDLALLVERKVGCPPFPKSPNHWKKSGSDGASGGVKTVQIGRFENRAISGRNPAMGCSGKEAIQKKIHGKKSWSWKLSEEKYVPQPSFTPANLDDFLERR
jgi:hypothetical protein